MIGSLEGLRVVEIAGVLAVDEPHREIGHHQDEKQRQQIQHAQQVIPFPPRSDAELFLEDGAEGIEF